MLPEGRGGRRLCRYSRAMLGTYDSTLRSPTWDVGVYWAQCNAPDPASAVQRAKGEGKRRTEEDHAIQGATICVSCWHNTRTSSYLCSPRYWPLSGVTSAPRGNSRSMFSWNNRRL